MRRTSFYPGGPERGPLGITPSEEVEECRRILGEMLPAAVAEIEQWSSAEELGAARDRELWGDDPWGEL